jgi:outer membrane protein assembly factor BamB/plastocyanin
MLPNSDFDSTRQAHTSTIDSETVSELSVAWTQPLPGGGQFGSFASTPLIDTSAGVVYAQDLASNVFALDLETGEPLWTVHYDAPSIGPNGLAFEDGVLFGVTPTDVFALKAEDGTELWRETLITIDLGVAKGESLGFTIQPIARDGTVYLSEAANTGGGAVLALDAADGTEQWRFDTTEEPEGDLVPSGGAWHTPSLDGDSVFIGVGNGYYTYNSPEELQNERLYTDSLLNLNADGGELEWYFQAIPNDFWDWDLQLSPILAEANGSEMVVTSGKLGIVYGLDRETGALLWETSVGEHNGHDDDGRSQLEGTLNLPEPPFEVLPGPYGGVETNMAFSDGLVYAAVVNLPGQVGTEEDLDEAVLPTPPFNEGTGELVAIDVANGEIVWQVELDSMPLGAMTISNDLVFTTTLDGAVHAYDRSDGTEVWSDELPTSTNAPVAIAGDTLVTAASFPQGGDEQATLIAYRLGAEEVSPDPIPTSPPDDTTPDGDSTPRSTDVSSDTTESPTETTGAEDTLVAASTVGPERTAGAEGGDISATLEVVGTDDLRFEPADLEAPAGTIEIVLTAEPAAPHDFVIEDIGDVVVVAVEAGQTASGTVTLEPGTYTFYCSVPGHRAAGMEGTLTVT